MTITNVRFARFAPATRSNRSNTLVPGGLQRSPSLKRSRIPSWFDLWCVTALVLCLAGCAGRTYQHGEVSSVDIRSRATVKTEGDVRVSAAVLSADETLAIFGIPLYEQGVQPVWLEIENRREESLRYPPTGTDAEYFSPLEIAYKNRGGYSKDARQAMDKRFSDLAMPRYIHAKTTVSGFVLTHLDTGTKGFNVDVFGAQDSPRFTFFITAPGFSPDHATVNFDAIYTDSDIQSLDGPGLYSALKALTCCSTDASGKERGSRLNVFLVGSDESVFYSLLRANWKETALSDASIGSEGSGDYFFRGRRQDAMFRYDGVAGDEGHYELRLWLSPMMLGDTPVWVGQVRHIIHNRWAASRLDPDLDNAVSFMMQNLWYAQTLKQYGWVAGVKPVSIEERQQDFQGGDYFTTGYRTAFWLSDEPVSLRDTVNADWDELDLSDVQN